MKNNMRRTSCVGCPFLIHIGGGFMKDIAIRALKTFWQSAIAYLVAALSTGVDLFEGEVISGLIIGALAAGISASWNGVVQPRLNRLKGGV
jgi:hypothetical protein